MDQIESAVRRVLQDHQKISSNIRIEEAKIDGLSKEIKHLEDRILVSESKELEQQRIQNLLNYQSTLIARASSRTDVLRALHEDLLILFIRRKQLHESGSWKTSTKASISHGKSTVLNGDDITVLLNGVLYWNWITIGGSKMFCFHVKNETLLDLRLPPEPTGCIRKCLYFGEYGGKLRLIVRWITDLNSSELTFPCSFDIFETEESKSPLKQRFTNDVWVLRYRVINMIGFDGMTKQPCDVHILHHYKIGSKEEDEALLMNIDEGVGGPGGDAVPNVSLSSGLSSGNDDNQGFTNDCSIPPSMDTMRMTEDHENLEEATTEEQDPIPLGLSMLQINMNEDACLTPENGNEYDNFQYKNNILENIAMSIMDPHANVDSIFKEAMENSEFPCETQGSKKVPKSAGHATYSNISKRLTVDFDESGNPTGLNAGAFKRSINSYVCLHFPVRFKQIGDVPVYDYKSVLNALTERYNFDLNRSYTRKKISSCYRQHKYKLLIQVKKDLESGIEPQQPSYVKKEDWNVFVAKTKDEEFDKISKKNKASRSQQSAVNRKGVSCTSAHKRKSKESEQVSADEFIWSEMNKTKRGRPRKLLSVVEDNHNAVDTIEDLHIDQEVVH